MNYELTKEDEQLLKRVRKYLFNADSRFTYAVYVSPAQQLRDEADAIEAKERDCIAYDELLNKMFPVEVKDFEL